MRKRIIDTLCDLMKSTLQDSDSHAEIYSRHDVHLYLSMEGRDHTMHVQAYPGMSTEAEMAVCAWLQDTERLRRIRQEGQVSIGNEHDATIPGFAFSTKMTYDAAQLKQALFGAYKAYSLLEKKNVLWR